MLVRALVAVALLAPLAVSAGAEQKSAAELLPDSVVFYAEAPYLSRAVSVVLDHPLRDKIESLDGVKKGMESRQYKQFLIGLAFVEQQLGMKWRPALEKLTEGGIYFAVDGKTKGLVTLLHAGDEKLLKRAVEAAAFTALQAQSAGGGKPLKRVEYRGVKAYRVNDLRYAQMGRWLLLTNHADLGKSIIDAHFDGREKSLATAKGFQTARKALGGQQPTLFAFGDLAAIRSAGLAKGLSRDKAENAGAEVLIGGVLSNLKKTPYFTAALFVESTGVRMEFATPHRADWVPEERNYFFGPPGAGAQPLPKLPGMLLGISVYRDLSQMWMRAGDLFDENTNQELAMADSNLATLFSGKDFGEDILGAIGPELQFLVVRQSFKDAKPPIPSIKLPSFALFARLKKPETMRSELRRIFQSLIGFFNIVGAMNGQPQLDLDIDKAADGSQVISASFVPDDNAKGSRKAAINYNFSPSIGFHKDRIAIGSTKAITAALVKSVVGKKNGSSTLNTLVTANLRALREVLDDNKSHLIAQNVLQEGNTREEAEQEISTLLTILGMIDRAFVRLENDNQMLRLKLGLRIRKQP